MKHVKLVSVAFSLLICSGGISLVFHETTAEPGFIQDLNSPAVTYKDSVWHKEGDFMLAVGEDGSGNGIAHKFNPTNNSWASMTTVPATPFKAVANTEAFYNYESVELGLNGWSVGNWAGAINWNQVNPQTLPNAPVTGTSHGSANNGNNVWWFGNPMTGSYDDPGSRVAGSLYSPLVDLPAMSSVGVVVFWHWFEVEQDVNPNFDFMEVSIKNDTDIGWHKLATWNCVNTSFTAWRQEMLYITGWLGNTVQLNFTFDSKDGSGNVFAGWHLDDIAFYTNDLYAVVGTSGPGTHSAYFTDGYTTFHDILGLTGYEFNDVAPGSVPLSFMTVGNNGAAFYFDGYGWNAMSGIKPGDTLTGIDFNGTHFFIVGYDSTGHGTAYYYNEAEFYAGQYALHPIFGAPDWKLNSISWNNDVDPERSTGLGAIAAEGSAMSICDPEMWYPIPTAQAPSARVGHAMAYDSLNNVVVLFGGFNGIGLDDTWVYDMATNSWSQRFPASAPSARRYHDMVYDSLNNKFILFGGYPYIDDTWSYDYPTNTWTPMSPLTKPSAMCYHAMVFDASIGETILFGGYDAGGVKGDTWTYNYQNDEWTLKSPASSPTARNNPAMAYDPVSKRTILFGGQSGSIMGDTWSYDATIDNWFNTNPTIAPSARVRHSMDYDAVTQRIVMFGGNTGSTNDETWWYDVPNNKWVNLFPSRRPAARSTFDMVFAGSRGQALLFGGDYNTYSDDTWICVPNPPWNGNVVDMAKGMNSENLTAACWNEAGDEVFFVGHNLTHGVLYRIYIGNENLVLAPDTASIFSGHEFYSIKAKPNSRTGELFILGASAFKVLPMMFDSSTRITVNVNFPHIFGMDFREQSTGISMLDTQVDVNNDYTFFIEANYTSGGVDLWNTATVSVEAWFDEGKVSTNSAPEASWSTEENRTRQFRITHDLNTGITSLDYPSPALEFAVHSVWEDPNVYAGLRHRMYINVTFNEQTRMADGQGFTFGLPAAGDIWNASSALNDPDSWDFRIRIEDASYFTSFIECFGEFGIKTFVAISAAGNPSVNAPPGTTDNLMPQHSQITYSSNTDYWVDVSIPHLYKDGNTLLPKIGAANVSVENIDPTANLANSYISAQTYFPSAGSVAMNVWGKNATSIASAGNGTSTSGPWITDYNAAGLGYNAYTELQWWVTVEAGVQEGSYFAAIVVTIRTL